jgi:hypothetical protein
MGNQLIRQKPLYGLETQAFQRHFVLTQNGLETADYLSRSDGLPLAEPVGVEAGVTVQGQPCPLGVESGFRFVEQQRRDGGLHPELVFFFTHVEWTGLRVELIYEAPPNIPVVMKRVVIHNASSQNVRIDGIDLGALVPATNGLQGLLLETDYVRDGIRIDGKRVYSPWIEHHNDYITRLLTPQSVEHRFGYPVAMDWWLAPGESFESFRVYEFVVDNQDVDSRGLSFRRITRELWPWTRDKWLATSPPPARDDVSEYYRAIDTAAEVGFEAIKLAHCWIDEKLTSPLFTNYNDYELRPELFPNGWDDVRKLTDYAHSKGLKISFYSIYVNTWRDPARERVNAVDDHRWQLVFAEDDKSSRWGTTLDPATDWGPFVNRKMEEAILKGGFDEYHLDGPYYGDISVSEDSPCRPGGPSQLLAWQRMSAFYQHMNTLGIHGEAAQGFCAFANGMSRITTTGYHEGDFGELTPPEQVVNLRRAMYDFIRAYRPEQATTFVCVYPWSPKPDAPSLLPMEDNLPVYEAYLASCFGYGFEGRIFQPVAYDGPRSRAATERWLGFWKDHEAFFKQGHVHRIRRPDGSDLDAVLHVLETGEGICGLLVVYNPTDRELKGEFQLPLKVLGGEGSEYTVIREREASFTWRVSTPFTAALPADSATWYELRPQGGRGE